MAKYKVGDKVRIANHRTSLMNLYGEMDKWLGKTMTIRNVSADGIYFMEEDKHEHYGKGWTWCDSMISGLAEPKFSISVHFHDRLTVAELIKDGKVVKAENARCNPKDKYSMAEGARIAVERLFRKKPSSSNNASKVRSVDDIASGIATGVRGAIEPKIGDKFVVIKRGCSGHHFNLGDVVTLVELRLDGAFEFVDKTGLLQTLYCDEVTYWRNASNEQTESNP